MIIPARTMKAVKCGTCNGSVQVDQKTKTATCPTCVQRLVGAPSVAVVKVVEPGVKRKRGRPRKHPVVAPKFADKPQGAPRGWHFKKEYTHTDGSIWVRGVRQMEGK